MICLVLSLKINGFIRQMWWFILVFISKIYPKMDKESAFAFFYWMKKYYGHPINLVMMSGGGERPCREVFSQLIIYFHRYYGYMMLSLWIIIMRKK